MIVVIEENAAGVGDTIGVEKACAEGTRMVLIKNAAMRNNESGRFMGWILCAAY